VADMLSPKRDASIVRARQVAMYLLKNATNMSLLEIGKSFGGRNHTTVMHSIKKVEGMMDKSADFTAEVERLLKGLREGVD
jgi:chromosomal replication initiator protein